MKKSIVYIISRLEVSIGFVDLFKRLKNDNVNFKVILINPAESVFFNDLKDLGIYVEEYYYHGKKDLPKLINKTVKFLKRHKPDVIHSHLLDAGFIGAIAGWIARVPLRVYTRHHGDMHFFSNKKGRYYDILIQRLNHKIIALSTGHLKLLTEKEGMKGKVTLVPNFFDEEMFNVSDERIETVEKKYDFSRNQIHIGVNARWTEWKGVHFAIKAFKELRENYPNIKLHLFNASGDYTNVISDLLKELPLGSYQSVKFEKDMMAVYRKLDYLVHVPIREGAESFGLVYIEAMGSGVPCVFTLSGIACDVVESGKTALTVPFNSSQHIAEALKRLFENSDLRKNITKDHKKFINMFTLDKHVKQLYELYK